jgi:Na+/melibiose symporter-like transporter
MMLGLKGGLSIGGALLTWILGLFGYITKEAAGVASEFIMQPESAIQGTKMLVSIFPSIPFLIAIGLLLFYEINKSMEVSIESDLLKRRNN